jgi:IS5 family transposase
VERHIEIFGRAPRLAATDRGFFSLDGERRIVELGVKRPVIPHSGHRSKTRIAHERQRWFRRGHAWHADGEARIARLKNCFGMARSRYRGEMGLKRSVYWAAIASFERVQHLPRTLTVRAAPSPPPLNGTAPSGSLVAGP